VRPSVLAVICAVLPIGAGASSALARPMDPELSRLVVDPGCSSGSAVCLPDRAAYHKLVSQWGFAIAPQAVHEARTTGLGGFNVSLLAAFTAIDSSADYWRRGTQGDAAEGGEASPSSFLQLYSLQVRKGFGFGIEAAGSVGVMPETSLVSFGADVRVALLEGMRHGVWRYLPDTSLGLGVREATGLGELALGTLAFDARISRPLAAPGGYIITPWLGYQWLSIDARSSLVDLTPGVDALAACGFAGTNVPGSDRAEAAPASGAGPDVFDGAPLCRNGAASGSDFANTVSFGDTEVQRHRVLLGVSYRQELLLVGLELIGDLVRPDAAQGDAAVAALLRCDASGGDCRPSPRQWTLALQLGAAF
jgi:hypothetical protein